MLSTSGDIENKWEGVAERIYEILESLGILHDAEALSKGMAIFQIGYKKKFLEYEKTQIEAKKQESDAEVLRWLKEKLLLKAAKKNDVKMVRLLIKENININARSALFEETALQCAAVSGHDEVVQLLIDVKADVNAVGIGASSLLAWGVYPSTARILIKAGANLGNVDKPAALRDAVSGKNLPIVCLLLSQGTMVLEPEILFIFLQSSDQREPEIMQSLRHLVNHYPKEVAWHARAEEYLHTLKEVAEINRLEQITPSLIALPEVLLQLTASYAPTLKNLKVAEQGFFKASDIEPWLKAHRPKISSIKRKNRDENVSKQKTKNMRHA